MGKYYLSWSGKLRAEAQELQRRASEQGRGQPFYEAFSAMQDRLIEDPNSFGEPTFDLPFMKLVNHVAVISPIGVEFCIDELRKIVYVRRILLLDEPKK
jgi:hypothetical protein